MFAEINKPACHFERGTSEKSYKSDPGANMMYKISPAPSGSK